MGALYDSRVNRESAYEMLSKRAPTDATPPMEPSRTSGGPGPSRGESAESPPAGGGPISDLLWGTKRRQGMVESLAKQAARTVGSEVGRRIVRGVLGGILGGSRRR